MAHAKRQLIWSDEFDYTGPPDPKKWAFEMGMLRNFEPQFYTSRPENARVENGMLIIEARREGFDNPWFDPNSGGWPTNQRVVGFTSANLVTRGLAAWTFGRLETRAKVPAGSGVWPAFWMLGLNYENVGWPGCGEIDIMEYVGQEPSHIHSTIHFSSDGKHAEKKTTLVTAAPADEFHVYAAEWFEDRIDFYFDDLLHHSVSLDGTCDAFRKPFYLQINLALGGWGGPIDERASSWRFLLDYVRVYR